MLLDPIECIIIITIIQINKFCLFHKRMEKPRYFKLKKFFVIFISTIIALLWAVLAFCLVVMKEFNNQENEEKWIKNLGVAPPGSNSVLVSKLNIIKQFYHIFFKYNLDISHRDILSPP